LLTLFEAGREAEWLASFRVSTSLTTRYSEIDSYGHVSNVIYPDYFEAGRMEYLDKVGDPEPRLHIFPFEHVCAELCVRFIQACHFNEKLLVHTKLVRLGGSSATLEQAITGESNSLRTIATTVIVRSDGLSTRPWSFAQRAALRAFDAVPPLES